MIVLVTGATSGFGAAIARRFAAEGHRLIAAGRRRERLASLVGELGATKVLPLALDVRDRAAVDAAIAGLPCEFSAIDVLVNNAGSGVRDSSRRIGSIRTPGSKWSIPTSRGSCT